MTSEFMAYDEAYTGRGLAGGRMGGGRRGRRARASSPASSAATARSGCGRRARGWTVSPRCTLRQPQPPRGDVKFRQIASFKPFAAAPAGCDGGDHQHHHGRGSAGQRHRPGGARSASTRLARPDPAAKTLAPKLIATLPPIAGCDRRRRRLAVGDASGQVPDHPGHELEHDRPEHQSGDDDARCPASSSVPAGTFGGRPQPVLQQRVDVERHRHECHGEAGEQIADQQAQPQRHLERERGEGQQDHRRDTGRPTPRWTS